MLLADDEPIVRISLARRLRDEGHTVTEAKDGAEAVTLGMAIPRLDVFVTDQNMPHQVGTEVARALRARHPGLFVVIMSGSTTKVEPGDGPWLVLAKPFQLAVLLAAIDKAEGGEEP
jgi:CheY-like chemotaxis protein